jgi:O-antigen ligase
LNPAVARAIAALLQKIEFIGSLFILVIVPTFQTQPRWIQVSVSALIYVFIFGLTVQYGKRILYALTKDKILLLFTLLAFVSLLWTADPSSTSDQLRFLLRATLFGVYLAVRYPLPQLMNLLSWVFRLTIVLCFVVSLAFPEVGQQDYEGIQAWTGIFTHKQNLGAYMGLATAFFVNRLFAKEGSRWQSIPWLVLAFVLVLFSNSATGLVIALMSVLLMPLYRLIQVKGTFRNVVLIFSLAVLGAIATLVILNFQLIVVDFLGKDPGLTGRIPLWIMSINKGMERPWLGFGYSGFWSSYVSDVVLFNSWAVTDPGFRERLVPFHSHNGYVDLFLQLGFVGLILFVLSFITLMGRIINLLLKTRSIHYFWMMQFAGVFLVNNYSEALNILHQSFLWIIYVALSHITALETYRSRHHQPAVSAEAAPLQTSLITQNPR